MASGGSGGSFPPRFDIVLHEMLELALGQCGGITSFGMVPLGMPNDMGTIPVGVCLGGCPCGALDELEVTFQGPLPPMPLAVVSNVVDPALTEPFGFVRSGSPSPPCMGSCDPGSGDYTLHSEQSGGFDVPPDGVPRVFTSGPVTYDVVNLGSGIDGECNELGRWFAVGQPG